MINVDRLFMEINGFELANDAVDKDLTIQNYHASLESRIRS